MEQQVPRLQMAEGRFAFCFFIAKKNERRPEMAEVIIKSIDELKEKDD